MGNEIKLCWLGQSGFLVRAGDTVLLADPYLSNSCAKLKSKLDHTRGTPIVRDPADLKVDWYLITHCHADHFDPETIIPVMTNNPDCRFFCPGDCRGKIEQYLSEKAEKFEFVSTGKMVELTAGIELHTIPAAHETLETDENGEYKSVSFLVNFRKEVFQRPHKHIMFKQFLNLLPIHPRNLCHFICCSITQINLSIILK